MPKVSQLNDATVTALMVRMGMGSPKRFLPRWAQPADGTDLSLAYDRAIAGGQLTLEIPEGNWTWSTPKNYVQGLMIVGAKPMKSSPVGGTRITAPSGFLKNADTTREQIVLRNLMVIGDGDSVCVDGPFGGTIEGCKFQNFDTLIQNMSGYLCFYRENAFADAAFGIKTADANGSVVEQCWFDDDVAVQITTRDGTPQSGVNSGLPFIIRENNFNLTDLTTVALRLRGQLKVTDNYFEKFSGSVANTMIDIEVNRFDHQGLICEGNELNGQSANCRGIYLNGSHLNLENWTEGRITCNRMLGLATYIEYGPNNRIPGLKIYGNSRTSGDFTIPIVNSYQNQHVPVYDGWKDVVLGADFTTTSATAVDVTGFEFTPEANASYEVTGMLMVRTSNTADGPRAGIAWPTGLTDGVARVDCPNSSSSNAPGMGNIAGAVSGASTGASSTTGSWPVPVWALFQTGASPSGTFKVQLFGETATTSTYTMRAGSFIKYRRIS